MGGKKERRTNIIVRRREVQRGAEEKRIEKTKTFRRGSRRGFGKGVDRCFHEKEKNSSCGEPGSEVHRVVGSDERARKGEKRKKKPTSAGLNVYYKRKKRSARPGGTKVRGIRGTREI